MEKFRGEFDDLKDIITKAGYNGEWGESDGKIVFRSDDGAVLNWWSSTGTLQIQGRKPFSEKLENAISRILRSNSSPNAVSNSKSTIRPSTDTFQVDQSTDTAISENAEKVFVVYGHDASACEQLELVLHRLKLDPFVLGNTGGGGLTIIETLEREISSRTTGKRFGIVLLTPDDMGYEHGDDVNNAEPRARQNVVMEMGMLIAAFGRQRVAILKKGHVVEPTDIGGIIYLPFNDHVKETAPRLCQRLRDAGFELDPDAIATATT